MAWDRMKWGIALTTRLDPKPALIGGMWHPNGKARYPGEPTRAVLFDTRAQARSWARSKTQEANMHSPDWRFHVVRVREVVAMTRTTLGE